MQVQMCRGRLNKQWPIQINTDTFPCKAKTNAPEQHFHYNPKHWRCWKCTNSKKKTIVEWVNARWQTQHRPKKGSKDSEYCYWVQWTDVKSIWKSSEIFLLISVEPHSKARRQHEKKNKKTHWIQTVWTSVCSRRTDKMEFWPETKVKQRSKMHHDWSRSYSGGNLAEELESRHLSGNFDRGDSKEKQDSSRPLMTWSSFKHIHNSSKQHIYMRKHKLSRRETGSASLQTEFDRRSDITEHVQNHFCSF